MYVFSMWYIFKLKYSDYVYGTKILKNSQKIFKGIKKIQTIFCLQPLFQLNPFKVHLLSII